MLAGLLFAIVEAEDRPGRLAATLPFGGVTLIEFQARTLVAAGAAQLVVVVERMTPELLGALNRIGRRGVVVDAVRSAADAAGKLHPLARVLMLADALVTTEEVVGLLAHDAGDALLVLPGSDAAHGWERVGAQMAWAGVARLSAERVAELARMPRDYDIQSTLLRLADQAGATHVALPIQAMRQGHGIEHRAAALAVRSRHVLAALVGGRRGWFDRWVLGTIARAGLPWLVERGVSGAAMAAVGGGVAAAGLIAIAMEWTATGVPMALGGCLVLALGAVLSGLRDEAVVERGQILGLTLVPAAAALILGVVETRASGDGTALTLAIAGVTVGALAERATPEWARRLAWGTPPAYLLLIATGAVAGWSVLGLALAASYAAATLGAGVEALRRHP
jgi:hypothetical protein